MKHTVVGFSLFFILSCVFAEDRSIEFVNGTRLDYTGLIVHERTLFVETATGGKTVEFFAVKASSLPASTWKSVRGRILAVFNRSERLHDARKLVQAREGYKFVERCLGCLDSKDLGSDTIDDVLKKAKGYVRVDGQWLTMDKYTKRKASELRTKMKAKGMVIYKKRWVTPRRKAYLEAYDKAKVMVKFRSKTKVPVSVIHSSDAKALCRIRVEGRDGSIKRPLVVIFGKKGRLKKGKGYTLTLYWSGWGHYFYDGGVRHSVSYSLDADSACKMVMSTYNLLPREGSGTGFAVTEDGYIVTNHHVTENAFNVVVHIGGKTYKAKKIAEDGKNDLAIIKIEAKLSPLSLAARETKLGQTVFTVGFPVTRLQGTSPKVTRGVISSLSGARDDGRMYQTDVSVQAGNSGGALADKNGDVVGVVCAKASYQAFLMNAGTLPENVNYAIKRVKLIDFLKTRPEVVKGLVKPSDSSPEFEDSVSRVVKATVRIVVNGDAQTTDEK